MVIYTWCLSNVCTKLQPVLVVKLKYLYYQDVGLNCSGIENTTNKARTKKKQFSVTMPESFCEEHARIQLTILNTHLCKTVKELNDANDKRKKS